MRDFSWHFEERFGVKMVLSKEKAALALVLICCAAFLLILAYAGHFSRYMADDYCSTDIALRYGVFGSVEYWYTTWAGHFTSFTLKGIVGTLGQGSVGFLPAWIILVWLGATAWTLNQISLLLRLRIPTLTVWVCAVMLLYAILGGTSNIIQSLYWLAANVPYTLPLVILTVFIGFFSYILRRYPDGKIPARAFIITGFLMFTAGGTSEVYVIFQTAVLGLAFIGLLATGQRQIKRSSISIVVVGILCSALAFLIILSAPGNSARQASYGVPLFLPQLIIRTLIATTAFTASDVAIYSPIPLLVTLVLSMLFVQEFSSSELQNKLTRRKVRILLALSSGIALVLIFVCIGPPLYAYVHDAIPSDRVLFIPHVVLVCTVAFWGCVMGLGLRRGRSKAQSSLSSIALAVMAILVLIGPIAATLKTANRLPDYQVYANEYDQRDREIREAAAGGVQDVKVNTLSVDMAYLGGIDIIGADPRGWVNICAAGYYGVKSLVALERVNE
jgi:hypothetical protein